MAHPTATAVSEASEALLRRAEANLRAERRAGAQRLTIAHEWTLIHHRPLGVLKEHRRRIGSSETEIYDYAPAELAIALEIHPLAARKLMADAVDLHDRLPHTWAAVQDLELDAWVARKIATMTADLDREAAAHVDGSLVDSFRSLPTSRLLALVEARVIEADTALADAKAAQRRRRRMVAVGGPNEYGVRGLVARLDSLDAVRLFATIDDLAHRLAEETSNQDQDAESLDVLRARALGMLADPAGTLAFLHGGNPGRSRSVVHVHTTPEFWQAGKGVARVETGLGSFAATRDLIRRLLGHDHITLRPVIDLADQISSDRYEIPADIAARVRLINPADVYPYAACTSRHLDLDHTIPWPHGPTSTDNLGPMSRTHHRIKTHAEGWSVEHLPGHRYLWRTPHGRYLLTDRLGTHRIGKAPPVTSRLEAHLTSNILEWDAAA